MALIRVNRFIIKHSKCYSSSSQQLTDEYTTVPHYPKILNISYEKRLERKKNSEYDEIKAVKTVEEKQIKLNMPRYYGFKCYKFQEDQIPYNNLRLAEHLTRTHLKEMPSLCDYYKSIEVDTIVQDIQSRFMDALCLELDGYNTNKSMELTPLGLENLLAMHIVRQLNRTCINNCATQYTHLFDTQIDYEPRIEAFWYAGGMHPPKNIKRYRTGKGQEWKKHTENDPTDRAIHYEGAPLMTLRHNLPLKPFIPFAEATKNNYAVPKWEYDPRVVGIKTNYTEVANVPGFWPGSDHQFGLLSFHKRGHMLHRRYNDDQDSKEAIHRQAILAAFGWLHSQANFLGFTTFNDITYPLATQLVITNGRLWSFYSYQMNTLLVHGKNVDENPKTNVCFATPELKLYEEFSDGKLVGFNDDVFRMILQFYANAPAERMGVNLRPFLSQGEKLIADYEDADKRQWLEREYKHLVSHRPRFKLPFELYHWEKIYKVDHKTRPMDARRRPFELFINPWNRKLNERQAFYIPRALRPDLPRHKGRYAKEYFP